MTGRDEAILSALTSRVKVFSVGQIHRTWWLKSDVETARARLNVLCESDWLVPIRLVVKDVGFFPSGPLFQTGENGKQPMWSEILSVTTSRWKVPLRTVPAVVASKKAAKFFGGHTRHPRPSESTHDLFLSGVYLRMLEERGAEAATWLGESHFAAERFAGEGLIPDAVLRSGSCCTAIEVVGESYGESRLKAIDCFCREKNWRYELW